jgi:hypothetical protein
MPADGWACLGIVGALVLMVPIIIALERRRLRRAEAAFLRGRQGISEAQFLAQVEAETDHSRFFVAGRQVMATLCGVSAEMIDARDSLRSLMDLQWDNGYLDDFLFALENQVGGHPTRCDPPPGITFGEFLRELHRHWVPPVSDEMSRAEAGAGSEHGRD